MEETLQKESFSREHLLGALEAILFLYGEPLSEEKLAAMLHIEAGELDGLLTEYQESLAQNSSRGLVLIKNHGSCVLATKPQFSLFLEQFVKENLKEDLTPAALETLSLISYFGPVSRMELDYVRGVNSSFTIRNLLVRGLIERTGSKGNAYVYEVSFDFLKHMGVTHVSQLPEYEKYRSMKETYFSPNDAQQGA